MTVLLQKYELKNQLNWLIFRWLWRSWKLRYTPHQQQEQDYNVGRLDRWKVNITLIFEQWVTGFSTVSAEETPLPGSPLTEEGLEPAKFEKYEALKRLRDNLVHIGTHNGLFLLKSCFLLPNVLYTQWTAPIWLKTKALEKISTSSRKKS